MDYYVRPQHIYSHSSTCTRSGLCRRPSSFVAFYICYLFDHSSIHEIAALVIMILVFLVYIRYIHLLWISWSILYCTWWWPHMKFVYHAYSWTLYSYVSKTAICIFAVMCIDCSLYCTYMSDWFFHLGLHYSTSGMDYIMYFDHHVTPPTSHIRGNFL